MDTLFIYLLVGLAVAIHIYPSSGDKIDTGLAVLQGELRRVITQKNEPLVLNCSVDHDPSLGPVAYTWTKDDEPLEAGSRVQVLSNGSLVIRRVIHRPRRGRSDEGMYTCRVTLGQVGTIIAREVEVLVAGIDRKFTIEPQPQNVPVGGVARFQCQVRATPPALYIWEKDQTKLPQHDDRYLFLSSGILQITGVRITDVGQYRCYATQGLLNEVSGAVSDIDGRYSSEAPLTVTTGPVDQQIVTGSDNVTVNVGTATILECLIQGPQDVVWTMEDGTIQQRVPLVPGGRVSLLGTNLQIHETELGDSGKYLCKAGNQMKTIILNVIKAPVLTKVPGSSRHLAGKWVYSQCLAEGAPSPEITYLFNGEPIQFGNEYKLTKVSDLFVGEGLVIVLSDQHHSGFYQCKASNSAGTAYGLFRVEFFFQKNAPAIPVNLKAVNVTSTSVRVVWDPPKPSQDPRLEILAYTVKYRRTDDSIITDTVSNKQQVELGNLEPFTQYTLYVQAFSSVGAGRKSAELTFTTKESVPKVPVTVALEPRARSILVKWSPLPVEERQGVIMHYKLFYRQQQMGSTLIVISDIRANLTSYIVRGLQPRTNYEVRMLASTSVGTGIFSDKQWPWVPIRTRDKEFVVEPVLTLLPVNLTTLNVSWLYYGDVEVDHYNLELLPLTTTLVNNTQSWNLPPTMRHHVITGLDESVIYEVSLTAVLKDKTEAQVVEEFRASSIPQIPTPRDLHVTLRTATSLAVSWYQPEPSMSQIVRYTVRFAEHHGQLAPSAYNILVSDTTSALLQGLLPGVQYEVSVQSHTEKLDSKFSHAIVESTTPEVASEPQNLLVETPQLGMVKLQWDPPAVANGNIKSYIVLYTSNPDESDDKWKKVTKNGSELSAMIPISDISGQFYTFKVAAVTDAGMGVPTQTVDVNPAAVTSTDAQRQGLSRDQELGIIIGVSICAAFIIVCVIIFLLRSRLFSSAYQQQQATPPQPPHFHGNGHIPGNGNGHALMSTENSQPVMSAYEMTPMLNQLPENEDSDSKGGGSGNLILTPNGAKLNGFVPLQKNGYKNGQVQNGHIKFLRHNYLRPLDAEQARGLIDAMMNGGNETTFITVAVKGSDGYGSGEFPDTVASLDEIDHIPDDEHLHLSGQRGHGDHHGDSVSEVVNQTSGDDSGAGSLSDSCGGGSQSRQTSPGTRQHDYPLDDGIHDYSPPSDIDTGSAESCHLSDVVGPVSVLENRDIDVLTDDAPVVCQCETVCVGRNRGGVGTDFQQQQHSPESRNSIQIPRYQPSTSDNSQAIDDAVTMVTGSSNINCSDDRVTDDDAGRVGGYGVIPVEVVHRNGTVPGLHSNGEVAAISPFVCVNGMNSPADMCNGDSLLTSRQPHFYSNGGPRGPHTQGEWRSGPSGNSTIPHCSTLEDRGAHTSPTGQRGGDSLSSPLAQLPQDAVESAKVKSSSPRQPHCNV